VKLTKCQNHHHHGAVFDTWIKWAKPQAEQAQGPAGRPNSLAGQLGLKPVRPAAWWTRVYTRRGRTKRWRKAVETIPSSWPAMWLGRSAATWQVTALVKSVELPHGPRNTPPPLWWKLEYTPHFRNSTYKALILSVVIRSSLVGRVVRLWGPEGLLAYREPSS
jgi:hypothetical protein